MKTYTITETREATIVWTYKVEAESETDALETILQGEIEPESMNVRPTDEEGFFDVEED